MVKYLLLIPIIGLFLSNVPLKMEMTIVKKKTAQHCGMMKESEAPCKMMNEKSTKACCRDKETTCVYFCCFQLVAPALNVNGIEFNLPQPVSIYNSYRQLQWNDPYISAPLRPPDAV
jgi:hypothetical protein